MDPAHNQTLLTLAFLVGPVIIGAAVLWYGVSKVQSTAGVLSCAVIATLLFAAALGLLFFLTVVSFNGGGGRARWLLMTGLIAGPGAVFAFLCYKLPRTWGKARAPDDTARIAKAPGPYDTARIAAVIAFAYSIMIAGVGLLSGGPFLGIVLWAAAGLALSWGLWRHAQAAWYVGVVFGALGVLQLIYTAIESGPVRAVSDLIGLPGLPAVMLLVFFGLLLSSNARESCLQKATP